jgi:transposase InsO family protein
VQPILNFLVSSELPADEVAAWQVQHRVGVYTIIKRELIKRSATGVFQHCVEPDKGIAILKDIHQGECGHHVAFKALVAKAFCHGFFWPTTLEDAKQLVRKCNGCQRFSAKRHQPVDALKTIPITWLFAVWGQDMLGPFKTAHGGMTHLLVAVDKFTKWIEAKPIKKLGGSTAVTFVKDITVRYGIPDSIITDNGTNFAKGALARFCVAQGIRLDLASVAHPQSNGQVERVNGLILSGIKPRLVEPLECSAGC